MGCEHRDNMIICSRNTRKYCACGRPCTKLCDFPLTGEKAGKTCDKPLCDGCAVHAGPELDYCLVHARVIEQEKQGQKPRICGACECPIGQDGCGCNPVGA